MKHYSEYHEDKWIMEHLPVPPHGFYVDIGCNLPDFGSNTSFLRDRGWDGIAVDGADYSEQWRDVRGATFVHAVLLGESKPTSFGGSGPCACAVPGNDLQARTLPDLLAGVPVVDFMSIDIEGAEFEVLSQLDFGVYQPSIIVAEYATMQPDRTVAYDYRLKEYLESLGYREVHRTVANIIYTRDK